MKFYQMIFPPITASKLKSIATIARNQELINEIISEIQKQIVDAAKKGYYETTREFGLGPNGKVSELTSIALDDVYRLFPGIEIMPGTSDRKNYVIYTFSWESA